MARDMIAECLKKLPRQWQIVIVISGAILVHISLGTIYTFGNMLPYILSYQKNRIHASISETSFTWLYTAQAGIQPLAMILGGWLERRIGPRFTVHVGGFIMCVGVFASRWSLGNSFFALLFTYGALFGTGLGIAYNAAIVCAMKWLPNNRGLASGLVLLGFGCGAFVFNPVQTHYINPRDYKPNCDLNGKKYFCQQDLLDRVPYTFLILAACYATMQLIGSIVLFNPDENEEERDLIRPDTFSIAPKEVLRSSTFYVLFMTFFCNAQTTYLISTLYKRFGEFEPALNDDNYLAWVGSVSSIFNAIGRPCWGALGDKYSYQVAMSTLTISAAVLMLTLQITPHIGRAAFMIWVCCIYLCLCGNFSLFPAVTAKAFGQKYMGINYGMVMSSNTLAGIISSLLAVILLDLIGYYGMFFVVSGFSFCGFLLTVFIQRTKHGKGVSIPNEPPSIYNQNYMENDNEHTDQVEKC